MRQPDEVLRPALDCLCALRDDATLHEDDLPAGIAYADLARLAQEKGFEVSRQSLAEAFRLYLTMTALSAAHSS